MPTTKRRPKKSKTEVNIKRILFGLTSSSIENMRKRFQATECGQRIEGDGQVENSNHFSASHDHPQAVNGVQTTKLVFQLNSKDTYSGAENGSKPQVSALIPDAARHFSGIVPCEQPNQNLLHKNFYVNYLSNNSQNAGLKTRNLQQNSGNNASYINNIWMNDGDADDAGMLLPRSSLNDDQSKSGLDNPVTLGPDQGYPKSCETTRESNSIMIRSSLSQFQLGRTDQMINHSFVNESERNTSDNNQRREAWTKLYGRTTSIRDEEEICLNSSQQSLQTSQGYNGGHMKSSNHLGPPTTSVLTIENRSLKSDASSRPIDGSLQFDKYDTVQHFSTNRTKSETSYDGQKMEEMPEKNVIHSSNARRESFHRNYLPVTRNKTFQNCSTVLCDQNHQNQFVQNPAYNLEESDQSVLDINDSIFDYLATGSISENSTVPANLRTNALSSSSESSFSQASKSASPDENQSRLDDAIQSVNMDDRKPMHTKMTQLPSKSAWQQNREVPFHVNFNLPNKKIFSSRHGRVNPKDACTDDGSMSFDIDDTILTVESIDSDSEQLKMMTNASHVDTMDDVKEKLNHLTFMYQQLYHLMAEKKKQPNPDDAPWRINNSNANPMTKSTHLPRRKSMRSSILESKHNKKHFQRLEAHVVTLVRSVASLTSQVRSHTNALKQIDILKEELENVKATLSENNGSPSLPNKSTEYERFRGWIPSLTNPRRVRKLTRFFGQEPPLLEIFLKKLGYERYTMNFSNEHIGMIELPYMTEERLQSIGIPMGPRLRILQESQLCFRQENFNIYII